MWEDTSSSMASTFNTRRRGARSMLQRASELAVSTRLGAASGLHQDFTAEASNDHCYEHAPVPLHPVFAERGGSKWAQSFLQEVLQTGLQVVLVT